MTTAIHRILAATDLSERAAWAERRAGMVAAAGAANLDLVHVVGSGLLGALRRMVAPDSQNAFDNLMPQFAAALSRNAEELASRYGIEVRTHLVTGTAVREIVECALMCSANLLVAGAHGGHFVRELILGATAVRLLEHAPCPVLMVKREPHMEYRRVLVPVDFSAASLAALKWAGLLAPNAEIHVLHAFEVPFERKLRFAGVSESAFQYYLDIAERDARGDMDGIIASAALARAPARRLIEHGYAPAVIGRIAAQIDADLIVMGAQGRSDLSYMLMGSVALHTIQNASCDVAAFRDRGAGAKS